MSRAIVMLWKEWRELRWFLASALLITVGLPLFLTVSFYCRRGRLSQDMTQVTLAFGAVLALIIAVAAATRDFAPGLSDFWRSRPVRLWQWYVAQYLGGLVVVGVVCILPAWIQFLVGAGEPPNLFARLECFNCNAFMWHSPTLILVYTICFALGVLVRKASHAALLGLVAILIVYFAPIVVPGLGGMSWCLAVRDGRDAWAVAEPLKQNPGVGMDVARPRFLMAWVRGDVRMAGAYVGYLWVLTALCVVVFAAGCMGIYRNWRVRLGRKSLVWTLGLTLVVLLTASGANLRSNLPCVATYELPSSEPGTWLRCSFLVQSGDRGALILSERIHRRSLFRGVSTGKHFVTLYDVEYHNVLKGPLVALVHSDGCPIRPLGVMWSPKHPNLAYVVGEAGGSKLHLFVFDCSPDVEARLRHSECITKNLSTYYSPRRCAIHGDRMYVSDDTRRMVVLTIMENGIPRLDHEFRFEDDFSPCRYQVTQGDGEAAEAKLWLIELPGIPKPDRLEVGEKLGMWNMPSGVVCRTAARDDVLVYLQRGGLETYRFTEMRQLRPYRDIYHDLSLHGRGPGDKGGVESLTRQDVRVYKRVDSSQNSPLQRMFDPHSAHYLELRDNWVVAASFDHGLYAYDISDLSHPRRVGYYATSEQGPCVSILSGNRILVADRRIQILQLPDHP